MAELLVRNIDNVNPTTKNPGGLYKRGDVVTVKPDGWEWGKLECLPNFIVITMPGDPSKYEDLVEVDEEEVTKEAEGKEAATKLIRRRNKRIMLENIEEDIQEAKTQNWLRIEKDRSLVAIKPAMIGVK